MRADRVHHLSSGDRFLEDEFLRRNLAVEEILLRSLQRLRVAQRQTELVLVAMRSTGPLVSVGREKAVASNHSAEISQAIVAILCERALQKRRCP